jgi:hypothetical protein
MPNHNALFSSVLKVRIFIGGLFFGIVFQSRKHYLFLSKQCLKAVACFKNDRYLIFYCNGYLLCTDEAAYFNMLS